MLKELKRDMNSIVIPSHDILPGEAYEEYKERMKARYYAHREHFIEYQRRYRELNKEVLTARVSCACGSVYRFSDASTHKKTKKHQAFLAKS